MMRKLKLLSSSFIMALTLVAPLATYAMELEEDHQGITKTAAPAFRPFNIHTYMAGALGLTNQHMNAIYHSTPELAEYPRHLQTYLVFKRDLDRTKQEEIVARPFASLADPLDGEFDFSIRGVDEKLSFNVGYRTEVRPQNKDKLEIWLAPYFLVEKNLQGRAAHLQDIMPSWDRRTVPLGVFFNRGDWNDLTMYDYNTASTWDSYSKHGSDLMRVHFSSQHHNTPDDYIINWLTEHFQIVFR